MAVPVLLHLILFLTFFFFFYLLYVVFSISSYLLTNKQGVRGLLKYYSGGVSKALLDLFPEVGLDKAKLWARMFSLSYSFLFILFRFIFIGS